MPYMIIATYGARVMEARRVVRAHNAKRILWDMTRATVESCAGLDTQWGVDACKWAESASIEDCARAIRSDVSISCVKESLS
jgi:hypothetical protein